MLGQCETFKEGRELKEHPNLAAEGENVEMADVAGVEEDGGGGWLPETVEGPQERWLSAATWAYDPNDDTLWDVKVDAFEYGNPIVGEFGEIGYVEFGFGGVSISSVAIHLHQVLSAIICQNKHTYHTSKTVRVRMNEDYLFELWTIE